jgi:aldehyde dehydrogenase (NAD+)
MTIFSQSAQQLRNPDRFFIGGQWVAPSTAATINVIDSTNEQSCLRVAEAQPEDMDRAIAAAREAFDEGPWPRLTPGERAKYLRAFADGWRDRSGDVAEMWPRESGVLQRIAAHITTAAAGEYERFASLAETFPFEERAHPAGGGDFGLLVREPVGVVGAITAWNGPATSISHKVAPAWLAGCTVIVKAPPMAPFEALIAAEIAENIGLPAGVLNVVTAERQVSELLVTDPRVDKIAFTGSTATGRRIGSLCGQRVARVTLELGGKSAAVILDDADLEESAATLATAECMLSGQVCSSLTRIVISRNRHDEFIDALVAHFSQMRVGDPFDVETQMGPLASERQRDRVEGYIAKGVEQGAQLATGGERPKDLDRGYYIEPTVFAHVDNGHVIAQEEIFGPVLSVIPAADEADAVRIANDTIYGLNASVFTSDVDRARAVASQLRSGTVGHNAFRSDFSIAFGGFKQSGIGREGGTEGLLPYLESKTIILNDTPTKYRQ